MEENFQDEILHMIESLEEVAVSPQYNSIVSVADMMI